MRKVVIIGAGAVGSTIGALLDQAGEQVFLIGRRAHVQAINMGKGLLMDGIKGEIKAEVRALETLDFRPDLVLLTVKTQDVIPALESIKPYIDGVPVLTMQNGVRSDELAAGVIGRENLMSAVMRITSTYLEPGRVTYVEGGGLVIGPPFPECRVPPEIFIDMMTGIMPTAVSSNIHGAHWSKLILNLNNALPAITGKDMDTFITNPALFRASVLLMKEGLGITRAHGVALEPLPDTPMGFIKLLPYMPTGIARRLISLGFRRARKAAAGLPFYGSTLQSIKRGRPTEIDYLNGEVVRMGKEAGIPTPYNERIVEMVHEIENTGRFLSSDELMRRLEFG